MAQNRAAAAQSAPAIPAGPVNSVVLVGRVSAEPEVRELPSGDELVTFRLIVGRAPRRAGGGVGERTTVDVIDIACWNARARRAARTLAPETVVRVEGALRRRFFRTGGGAASRYEVEAASVRREPSR
ncbi:MAG TPA: single-stranded DNA-binding protein [Intrasporangiaceae bacterium]|nr:single-stranded DNA-binding protein [Intrasporangiaceae bacterium]